MLLSTVTHWLEARWVSPESLLRLVETFREPKMEADEENPGDLDTRMEDDSGDIGGIPTDYFN